MAREYMEPFGTVRLSHNNEETVCILVQTNLSQGSFSHVVEENRKTLWFFSSTKTYARQAMVNVFIHRHRLYIKGYLETLSIPCGRDARFTFYADGFTVSWKSFLTQIERSYTYME